MDIAPLETWIRRRLTRNANTCLLPSPIAIPGGILTLFFTFWFSYAVIWMVLKVLLSIPELLAGVHWSPDGISSATAAAPGRRKSPPRPGSFGPS